jgi:molecular chaperone Hsp33
MQSNIKFNGALVLQVFGDGPVKLAVAEAQSDFALRATATVNGDVASDAGLSALVNLNHGGRCAITLDPKDRLPGQQPYQGVVPLSLDGDTAMVSLSQVLEHYMRQSEQLETTLVLAADDRVAAGLLIQRLPLAGAGNLAGSSSGHDDPIDSHEDYRRIAILASSLQRDELLTLDSDTILRRLFWQEKLRHLRSNADDALPHFACNCSRERVEKMLVGLGQEEAQSILAERGEIEVGCEFCGAQERFDAVDVAQIFSASVKVSTDGAARH